MRGADVLNISSDKGSRRYGIHMRTDTEGKEDGGYFGYPEPTPLECMQYNGRPQWLCVMCGTASEAYQTTVIITLK